VSHGHRPAWAEVDPAAVRDNVTALRSVIGTSTALCAVVKADGYGHGAVRVAEAAIEGGASGLAVALVEEGVALREAGLNEPVLLLSEPPPGAGETLVEARLTPTLYDPARVAEVGDAARRAGRRLPVHVKVDTGMHRVGAAPELLGTVVEAVAAHPSLELEGVWTHLAVADEDTEESREFTVGQLARFASLLDELAGAGHRPPVRHTANTAGAVAWPSSRYEMVRCGIGVYGYHPSPAVAAAFAAAGPSGVLRPVLSLRARVAAVRELDAGSRPSYGRRRPLPERSFVATVPLGYADGVPRRLGELGMEVLIGGRRRPVAGTVTMDQVMVDCGPTGDVAPGDEVVLLGRQGDEEVTADEWAARLGTISYEVLTGIGPRVPRTAAPRPPGGSPERPVARRVPSGGRPG